MLLLSKVLSSFISLLDVVFHHLVSDSVIRGTL